MTFAAQLRARLPLALFVASFLIGCSERPAAEDAGAGDCPLGAAGCACTFGGGCDPGLVCSAGTCASGPVVDGGQATTDSGPALDAGLDPTTDAGASGPCVTPTSCVVPSTHATVQAAVDDGLCPSVCVLEGTWVEPVYVARDLVLEGAIGQDVILDGAESSAVLTVDGADVKVRGLTLTGGAAERGAGLHVLVSTVELEDVIVEGNVATREGGGVASDDSLLVLRRTIVRDNQVTGAGVSVSGGGIVVVKGSLTLIEGSAVESNTVTLTEADADSASGGGIAAHFALVTLEDSRVGGNAIHMTSGANVSNTAFGGGVSLDGGTLVGYGADISDNTIQTEVDPRSFAFVTGGGIAAVRSPVRLMEGTTVAGNALMTGAARRAAGGGLYLSNSSLVATDLVVDNNAVDGFQDSSGGGIWTASSAGVRLDLERVAITRNTVATGPAAGDSGTANSGAALMVLSLSSGVGSPQPLPLRLRLVNTTIAANTASAATVSDPPVVVVGAGAPGDTVMSHLSVIGNTGGQHLLRVDLSSEEGAPGVIASSLFADNTPATCTGFGLRSGGGNLFSTSGCAFEDATDDVTGVDPLLGELGDHGGSTLTVPLLPGSPAIDAADCAAIAGVFMAVDQRGAARNALCDVGAYELSSP